MIQASNQFIEAITAESRQFKASLLCNGEELDCEITNMEIHKGASGDQIVPGAVFIPYMEFSVRNCSAELTGKTIAPIINLVVDYDETGEPIYDEDGIRLGEFIAIKPLRATDSLSCKAVGKLGMRGGLTYTSSLTYPAALANVITELSSQLNMPIILKGLSSSAKTLEVSMSGELLRDALGYVGCILGGFVTEDNVGNIVISKYGAGEPLEVAPWKSQSQPSFAEEDWECTGIKVVVSEEREEAVEDSEGEPITTIVPEVSYSHGTPNIVVFNPYMTEALFNSMYQCIEGYSFRPGNIDMNMGDPRLEAWDYLVIEDLNGTTHTMPCLNISHKYHGGCESSISCDIKTSFEETAETIGPMSKQLASAINDAEAAKTAAEAAKTAAEAAKTAADTARNYAEEAKQTTDEINAYAETAGKTVTQILNDGETAGTKAQEAIENAGIAYGSAQASLQQLSLVEDVIGTLNWISQHGIYTACTETEVIVGKTYYTLTGTAISNPTGNPSKNGYYELVSGKYVLSTDTAVDSQKTYYQVTASQVASPSGNPSTIPYYELGVDEAVTQYINTHLALTDSGLSVTDGSRSSLLISSNGVTIYGSNGQIVGQYGEGAIIGDILGYHIEMSGSRLSFMNGTGQSATEIAYMTNNELYIPRVVVVDSMQIGNWKWNALTAQNHLTLKWEG